MSKLSYLTTSALVATSFIDVGNFVSAIAGGSEFKYQLLFIILISSLVGIFVQDTAIKLGLFSVYGDLSSTCRSKISNKYILNLIWITAEIALVSTDFAEIIGSTIAINLLFPKISLVACLLIAAVNIFIIITLSINFKNILQFVVTVLFFITALFIFILVGSVPNNWLGVLLGVLPTTNYFSNISTIFILMAIFSATVMPHNIYLHSNLVSKNIENSEYRIFAWNNFISLLFAFLINASILIVSASVAMNNLEKIPLNLYSLFDVLSSYIGYYSAVIFAIALFLAGQSATITVTITSIVILKGFKNYVMNTFIRRMIGRSIIFFPALILIIILPNYTNLFLIWSQVILGFMLPFTLFPLFFLSFDENVMGKNRISRVRFYVGMLLSVSVVIMNIILLLNSLNLI